MPTLLPRSIALAFLVLSVSAAVRPATAQKITTPKEFLGHNFGDDYYLANYTQIIDYWQKLAKESKRIVLERIGTTWEGRPMWMAIVSSPENIRKRKHYQGIAATLARAENVDEKQARALAAEGKAVVWFDGGLHSSETLCAQQLGQMVYEMVSGNDAETKRFLDDVIGLFVIVNPDGIEMVSNWYMREADTLKRSLSGMPRLYNKYVGHDNNRDFYMASQLETRAIDSILFRAWYPQIMYNHHQSGPGGTVMFTPPFRDPFNYNLDPLVMAELDLVGSAMQARFISENKPGIVSRHGASFSTWYNGGLRTTTYFHNIIGLLTETIGGPTPTEIPFVADRLVPNGGLQFPILPQKWHFAQSVAYSLTANRAVLDVASRYRETLLYNIYRMGRNSIEKGSKDSWTLSPSRIAPAESASKRAVAAKKRLSGAEALAAMQTPQTRDPRAYIIPSDQPDFLTATKFANALIYNGVTVHRGTQSFSVNGKSYPAGSYVVKTAQAFRPHIMDMFEPQDHPNDVEYPGGPPIAPYDVAGWTLAYQMGVRFERILDAFDAPLEVIRGLAQPPKGAVASNGSVAGYTWTAATNDAFLAAARLLSAGANVSRLPNGDFFVASGDAARRIVDKTAAENGVAFTGVGSAPPQMETLRKPRIALLDSYGGSMTSGWTRYLLDQFEIPHEVIYAKRVDDGNLRNQFDVVVLPSTWFIQDTSAAPPPVPDYVPAEFKDRWGNLSRRSVAALKQFLEAGGTVLAIEGSARFLAEGLGLPLSNPMVDSAGNPLPNSKFYIPGSVLRMRVDTSESLARGMPVNPDVYFVRSSVFTLNPNADQAGIRTVAWFDSATPLRSGWAVGQSRLKNTAVVVEARVGQGKLVLYGADMNFRGQSHGTYKLFFNGIYGGAAASREVMNQP
jgi:hypothetical protein